MFAEIRLIVWDDAIGINLKRLEETNTTIIQKDVILEHRDGDHFNFIIFNEHFAPATLRDDYNSFQFITCTKNQTNEFVKLLSNSSFEKIDKSQYEDIEDEFCGEVYRKVIKI